MSNFSTFCRKHGIEPLVIDTSDESAVSLRILKLERELEVDIDALTKVPDKEDIITWEGTKENEQEQTEIGQNKNTAPTPDSNPVVMPLPKPEVEVPQ